jgi:uncharacterized protein
MRWLLKVLCLLLLTATGAAADEPSAAHPALWRVTGRNSTVYLLGSVHILSPTLAWRDGRIDKAVRKADGFFFETSLDSDAIARYVADKGSLPPGGSLRAMLPAAAQKNLDDDLASVGMPEASIDTRRPWYASIAMTAVKLTRTGESPAAGVDVAIMADAKASGKPIRYFETVEQQLALLGADDPKFELSTFVLFLKDYQKDDSDLEPLVNAWATGDDRRVADLLLKEIGKQPGLRKALFDDRNRRWAKTLKDVLDNETGTFLVTVGAGHLITDRGVPALLRRAGYRVERL